MPVKRRIAKQRAISVADELQAWSVLFGSGFDFFDDLDDIGLPVSRREGHPMAKEAWRRLGAEYLRRHDAAEPCWALDRFGSPGGLE